MLHTLGVEMVSNHVMVVAMYVVGGVVAMTAIIASTARAMASQREREQTRREIAAYVAEGTMAPDDAERILNAGGKSAGDAGCAARRSKTF